MEFRTSNTMIASFLVARGHELQRIEGPRQYSGRSRRWLEERVRAFHEPLRHLNPMGGKVTVKRSEFDQWMARQQPKKRGGVSGIVDEIMASLREPR